MKNRMESLDAAREGRKNTASLSHRNGGPRLESNGVSLMTLPSSRIEPKSVTASEREFSAITTVLVLKEAMAQDLADCARRGITRDQVADAMTSITGERISRSIIDRWVAATKTGRVIPALKVSAWALATGSQRVPTLLCREIEMVLIPAADQHLVDLIRQARFVFDVSRSARAVA